jgi:hypothetical protein
MFIQLHCSTKSIGNVRGNIFYCGLLRCASAPPRRRAARGPGAAAALALHLAAEAMQHRNLTRDRFYVE